MEVNVEAFLGNPTAKQLEKFRKKDLLQLADALKIEVVPYVKKQVIKSDLLSQMIALGILPEEPPVASEVAEEMEEPSGRLRSVSPERESDPMVALKLKELELQIKQQEHKNRLLQLREMELHRVTKQEERVEGAHNVQPVGAVSSDQFDPSRYIRLVPPFRETEVDAYFTAFERVAGKLRWPRDMWALMLQSNLVGKAQEVCAAMPIEDSLNYDLVKTAVLRAYELVPEAYRQKFRGYGKSDKHTFLEFARDKRNMLEKWCAASKVNTFEGLQELILLEDFKNCLPESLVVHLNEQKVTSLADAAVMADEYVLTHKNIFVTRSYSNAKAVPNKTLVFSNMQKSETRTKSVQKNPEKGADKTRSCFYCLESDHLIADCKSWKQKNASRVKRIAHVVVLPRKEKLGTKLELPGFIPFLTRGTISLSDSGSNQHVSVLRDTGSGQSLIRKGVLPLSADTYTGMEVLVRGIELGCVKLPIHSVYLKTDLVTGMVNVGVCEKLPVDGVDVILGNDLAGGKVFPSPIVTTIPVCDSKISLQYPDVFPVCAVTRSQTREYEDQLDLSDSFLVRSSPTEFALSVDSAVKLDKDAGAEVPIVRLGRAELAAAQKTDSSLAICVDVAVSDKSKLDGVRTGYYWDDEVLMRKWNSVANEKANLAPMYQIVLPSVVRTAVLKLAHDHIMGGHLGVNKTFQRVSQYFYWPGLRTGIANYCRSCHECQLVGKPNQVVRPVPLCPIPVMGEPFERLILDCVGPLPKSREGYQYILSFMCSATRFPEAVPLRNLKAKTVIKELVKFCSYFGLPRVIQTDRGTNFTSKLFNQVMDDLTVKHVTSSAFHPQSQGALERFHQTLKTMLKTHCLDSGRDWAESLPLLMFAIRESVQDSLGFSPAELVFGHIVRGPLKLLSEQLLATKPKARSVSEYVDTFRKRLKHVRNLARANLTSAQAGMKAQYDQRAVQRSFKPGELVLALLPVPGSALQNRFTGPYVVEKKLNDTTYVIRTPERRRDLRTCHINMLKQYHEREKGNKSAVETETVLVPIAVVSAVKESEEDDVETVSVPTGSLQNSNILQNLNSYLKYMCELQRVDVVALIEKFPTIFSDVPSQTNVLFHDIDVGNTSPIMQHPYRVNPVKREIMKSEIKYMLQNGLAVSSQSAWSSPCVLVPKSDGSFRFCTDYRKINAVTKPDSFPLPRIDDCIDKVGPAKFVTKLDLLKGYWQVPLTPRAAEISAFVTPDFFGQYSVMAFGMRNAPSTFQRLMRLVLQDVPDCEAYLDDIVIYSPTWEEHMKSLETVFARLANAVLTVNLAKCEFAKATITYLGKQVGQGKVKPVDAKIIAITELPRPSNRRELRRFLGMTGYYRGFCRNFATLVAPLTDLLKSCRKFVWSPECENAFIGAKDLLCKAPILAAPDFSKAFMLEVDASGVAAGAVLLQTSETNLELPVCYFSKKFSDTQRRYSTVEKEALALLLALQHFDVYLSANPFPVKVYTDHNPLVFLSRMQNLNQRLMRWSLVIQEYNLEIVHKRGSEMVLSDALSRAVGT